MTNQQLIQENEVEKGIPNKVISELSTSWGGILNHQTGEFAENISKYLRANIRSLTQSYPSYLFSPLDPKRGLSSANIRRVLTHKSMTASPPPFRVLDLLCRVALKSTLVAKILEYQESNPLYTIKLPPYAIEEWKESVFQYRMVTELGKGGITIIDKNSFDKEKNTNAEFQKELLFNYYFKFTNTEKIIRQVIANKIYAEPSENFTLENDDQTIQCPTHDVIARAWIGRPLLLKILNIGGSGKSTLVWHLIYKLCNCCTVLHLRRISLPCVVDFFTIYKPPLEKQIIIVIDNFLIKEEIEKNLVPLGEIISDFSSSYRIVLLISERAYRYSRFEQQKEFELIFTNNNYRLSYSNESIRKQIFFRILQTLGLQLSKKETDTCLSIFNNYNTESFIDSAFHLFLVLKKTDRIAGYTFEWEDWKNSCKGRFELLSDLFTLVAFFYQFGIPVPLTYLEQYYNTETDVVGLVTELLNQEAPIILYPMDNTTWELRLRHEKMAEWYFKIIPNGIVIGTTFFKKFLNNVKSKESASLFTKVCRNNIEFNLSPYKKLLPPILIIKVIAQYLNIIGEGQYDDEEFSMLMEQHFALANIGRREESLEPLHTIIKHNPNNIDALARLANSMEDADPELAEQLYIRIRNLPGQRYNQKATFCLLLLYQKSKNYNSEQYEKEIFSYASVHQQYATELLNFISENFNTIGYNISTQLLDLYCRNSRLGIKIADTLIQTKSYKDALHLLRDFASKIDKENVKLSNEIAGALLRLYQQQDYNDHQSLKLAELLLKKETHPDAETYFLSALLLSTKETVNYRQVEMEFEKAYSLDQSDTMLIAISRFYRNVVRTMPRHQTSNAIGILLKGYTFLTNAINQKVSGTFPLKLEQAVIANDIIQRYYLHTNEIDKELSSFTSTVEGIEKECLNIFELGSTYFENRLPKIDKNLFTNYSMYDKNVKLFSKFCSVKYNYYTKKALRISVRETNRDTVSHKTQLYKLAESTIQEGLAQDPTNPILIVNLIDIKLALKDPDLENLLDITQYETFLVKDKARLCKLLIRHGYTALGKKLVNQFGRLNSTEVNVKNDLAFSYISIGLWKFAIVTLEEIENPRSYTFTLIRRLALEIPITSKERADACIKFCRLYLTRRKYDSDIIYRLIEVLYISGDRSTAFRLYKANKKAFNTGIDNNTKKENFETLCQKFYPGLVHFIFKRSYALDKTFDGKDYKTIEIVKDYVQSLITIKMDFSIIKYGRKNDNSFHDELRMACMFCINIFFEALKAKQSIQIKVFDLCLYLITSYDNPLFNKLFLRELIRLDKANFSLFFEPILDFFHKKSEVDSDISRLLGRYYLGRNNFSKSEILFKQAKQLSKDEEQASLSNFSLANWIISKIETEGTDSFGSIANVCTKLKEANTLLSQSQKFDPYPKHYEPIYARMKVLEQRNECKSDF